MNAYELGQQVALLEKQAFLGTVFKLGKPALGIAKKIFSSPTKSVTGTGKAVAGHLGRNVVPYSAGAAVTNYGAGKFDDAMTRRLVRAEMAGQAAPAAPAAAPAASTPSTGAASGSGTPGTGNQWNWDSISKYLRDPKVHDTAMKIGVPTIGVLLLMNLLRRYNND